jgi:hypothetical protein
MSLMIIQLCAPPSKRSEIADRIRLPGWRAVTEADPDRELEEMDNDNHSRVRRLQPFVARTSRGARRQSVIVLIVVKTLL